MKKYERPFCKVFIIYMEDSISSTSNARLGIDPSSNTVEVENWTDGSGFDDNDFVIIN
ncbi:hypothetical protein [Sphingobacterium bovistauri]|uniref:Uncharacterized protein n=1 Tax=Sphingobacterium bovistauri TaxID=2781959 RepID=A0ABS7ZAN1_9SPHI|nr:hypothetical protein [Sphingobacterium bovistauri]MCA5005920.1 hypothetical protein [Sphingobacterium bovistauri]